MAISSSSLAGSGRITVLKRRFKALDSSFTPLSRLLALAMTLKPRVACTSLFNSGIGRVLFRMVIRKCPAPHSESGSVPRRGRSCQFHRPPSSGLELSDITMAASQQHRVVQQVVLRYCHDSALNQQGRIARYRCGEMFADPQLPVPGISGNGAVWQPMAEAAISTNRRLPMYFGVTSKPLSSRTPNK